MFSLHFRVCRFKKRYPGAGRRGPARRSGVRPEPPLPTGGRGHVHHSDARPEPPCPPGAGVALAGLAHGRSSPCPPGAGGACRSGARLEPPPHRGPGTHALLWRVAGAHPAHRGRARSSGARMFFFAFQGMQIPKKVYNFDPFFDWTSTFLLV